MKQKILEYFRQFLSPLNQNGKQYNENTKPQVETTADTRWSKLMENKAFFELYSFSETLEGKELIPDFFAFVDLLENHFQQIIKNKKNPLQNLRLIENLELPGRQKLYFVWYLSKILLEYGKSKLEDGIFKNAVVIQLLSVRLFEQNRIELEERTLELRLGTELEKIKNEILKKEFRFLYAKKLRDGERIIELKAEKEALETDIQPLSKRIIELKAEKEALEAGIQPLSKGKSLNELEEMGERLLERKEYIEEKIKQAGLPLPPENNQINQMPLQNSFYKTARNLRQKVLFYLITKHRLLLEPETITRAQLARNIAKITDDKESGIKDVLQNKLKAKENSPPAAKILATDLRAVFFELKRIGDKKGCEIVKNEIQLLGEDVKELKNS